LRKALTKNVISLIVLSIVLAFATAAVGCAGSQASKPVTVELNVLAAASLTDALKEINGLYLQAKPGVTVIPNLAASGTLQKQVENGAPADVFLSAGAYQMDALQKQKLILDDTRKNLLMNQVALIVPNDSTLGITSFNDLAGDKVKKLAIGDPKFVPCGVYAQQAFDLLGISGQVKPKVVIGSDARQVLHYVESGNVDAGVVYVTDAWLSSKVRVIASAPDAINSKVVYPVAVVKASKNVDAARDYEGFLSGAQAKAAFEKYGFTVVGN
jgi:molybdate transport system substrate-binding protein